MVNLISENYRQGLIASYKKRRLAVVLFLLLFLFLIGIILLVTFLAMLYLENRELNNLIADRQQEIVASGLGDFRELARKTNAQAKSIVGLSAMGTIPTEAITKINSLKPAGIAIKSFSFTNQPKTGALLVAINGQADSRPRLVEFVEKLKKDSTIKDVDAPVSNLIKDINNNFSLAFIISLPS